MKPFSSHTREGHIDPAGAFKWLTICLVAAGIVGTVFGQSNVSTPDAGNTITTVRVDSAHLIKKFDPDLALGTSIDILRPGDVDRVYSDPILKESLSAGWGPITYRQNTELLRAGDDHHVRQHAICLAGERR